MARGKVGGGSSGGSSSGSSSCDKNWPCNSEIRLMYGNRSTSVYSSAEMYGQLAMYVIWAIVLVLLLIKSWMTRVRMWLLQSAMVALLCACIFLSTRYGMIVADSSPPVEYRVEAAFVDMLWEAGILLVLATLLRYTKASIPLRVGLWIVWGVLTGLTIAYVVFSFVLSNDAVNYFKQEFRWRLSDRDFGETYSRAQFERLKTNGSAGLSFFYIQRIMFDGDWPGWVVIRGQQINMGLAMHVLAFLIGVALTVSAAFAWIRKRHGGLAKTLLALAATFGLLLATIFNLVVTARFILPNWQVLNDDVSWRVWRAVDSLRDGELDVLGGYLPGYRLTADGFPVVQAVLVPFGIIITCAAMLFYAAYPEPRNSEIYDPKHSDSDS